MTKDQPPEYPKLEFIPNALEADPRWPECERTLRLGLQKLVERARQDPQVAEKGRVASADDIRSLANARVIRIKIENPAKDVYRVLVWTDNGTNEHAMDEARSILRAEGLNVP